MTDTAAVASAAPSASAAKESPEHKPRGRPRAPARSDANARPRSNGKAVPADAIGIEVDQETGHIQIRLGAGRWGAIRDRVALDETPLAELLGEPIRTFIESVAADSEAIVADYREQVERVEAELRQRLRESARVARRRANGADVPPAAVVTATG